MGVEEVLSIIIQYKQILFVILALFGLLIIILVDDIKSVQIISALVICGIVGFHNIELLASIPDRLKENRSSSVEATALQKIPEQDEDKKEEEQQTTIKVTIPITETTNTNPTKKFLNGIWQYEGDADIKLQFTDDNTVGLYVDDVTMIGTYTLSGNRIQMNYTTSFVDDYMLGGSNLTLYFKPHENKRKCYLIMEDGTTMLFSKLGGL